MQRRVLLERTAALITAGTLAGCVGNQYGMTDDTAAEPATTGSQSPTLADRTFSVTGSGCGNETNTASVSFDDGKRLVTVTGTITGSDACKTATLEDATYDSNADELAVTVAATDKEDAGMCAQCLTEIDYEAEFSFDGGLPSSVTVVHDSLDETRTVQTSER